MSFFNRTQRAVLLKRVTLTHTPTLVLAEITLGSFSLEFSIAVLQETETSPALTRPLKSTSDFLSVCVHLMKQSAHIGSKHALVPSTTESNFDCFPFLFLCIFMCCQKFNNVHFSHVLRCVFNAFSHVFWVLAKKKASSMHFYVFSWNFMVLQNEWKHRKPLLMCECDPSVLEAPLCECDPSVPKTPFTISDLFQSMPEETALKQIPHGFTRTCF